MPVRPLLARAHLTPRAVRLLRATGLGLALFLLLRPLFGIVHELLVVLLAGLLARVVEAPLWAALVQRLPVDPVYTLALIAFAGEVQARGVAVAPPVGDLLHLLAPGWFLQPGLAEGAWASAVLEPGATVLARSLSGFGANLIMLGAGLALTLLGLPGRRPWLAVAGGLQQVHVLCYQFLHAGVSLPELEAAGLPFAISSLLSDPNNRDPWFTSRLETLPEALVTAATGLVLAGLAYLLVGGLLLPLAAWRLARRWRRPAAEGRPAARAEPLRPAAALGLLVLLVGASPLGSLAAGQTRLAPGAQVAVAGFSTGPGPVEPKAVTTTPAASNRTVVQFIGQHYQYALLVNGVPTVVRGMGYNPSYANLPTEERIRRYDRDFAMMRDHGVNVIFGWFQQEFDQVTLDAAQRHGLGVGMPFELNQDHDYADPAMQARLTAEALEYVARYRDHPAVWFWTPGNEVIHRLIFPSWLKRERDLTKEARADAFARYYVGLIDQIHALDPHHPVIYRDAEEVYLARIRENLLRDGVRRPWFAYGTNVYSPRLPEILTGWPQQGLDVPLLVSEFSPGGVGPAERPSGLQAMWQLIRAYPGWVIGGVPYTWTTDGPEELDRVFGLVDGEGRPRDGSLAAIGEMYARDQQTR